MLHLNNILLWTSAPVKEPFTQHLRGSDVEEALLHAFAGFFHWVIKLDDR